MRDDEERDRRPLKPLPARRLAVTVGGALVLLLLVVVASRGDRPSGTLDTGGRTTSLVLLNSGLLVVAIIVAVLVAFTLYAFNPGRSGRPQPRTGSRLLAQLMLLLLLAAFAFAIVTFIRDGRGTGHTQSGAQTLANFLSFLAGKRTTPSGEGIDWVPVLLVFCATLGALLVAGVHILRRTELPEPRDTLNARLAILFDDTLNDLRAERDPRRAVIAAYGRMEIVLGRSGLERRPSEAPHEYVSRVLGELVSSGSAVRRLTGYYELAKFSDHEIDEATKDDAIDAVEIIRDELRANEAQRLVVAA